jgi:hypothetical protein
MDGSIPRNQPHHNFRCKVCLLFWTGNYYDQARINGMHAVDGCRWCTSTSEKIHGVRVSQRVMGGARRHLPAGHPLRGYRSTTRPAEHRPRPPLRTHASVIAATDGQRSGHRYGHRTYVRRSPLASLPYFDLVEDMVPDMLNIVNNMWTKGIFKMFAGTRKLPPFKTRAACQAADVEKLFQNHAAEEALLAAWVLTVVTLRHIHYFACFSACVSTSVHICRTFLHICGHIYIYVVHLCTNVVHRFTYDVHLCTHVVHIRTYVVHPYIYVDM